MESACFKYESDNKFCSIAAEYFKKSGLLNSVLNNNTIGVLKRYFKLLHKICAKRENDCSDFLDFCYDSKRKIKSDAFLKYIKPKCDHFDKYTPGCNFSQIQIFEGTVYENWWCTKGKPCNKE